MCCDSCWEIIYFCSFNFDRLFGSDFVIILLFLSKIWKKIGKLATKNVKHIRIIMLEMELLRSRFLVDVYVLI